jgi:hypothetical protein
MYNPKPKKKGQQQGPLEQRSPSSLPTTSKVLAERLGNPLVQSKPVVPQEAIVLPDGSYSSLIEGPTYKKQFVAPVEEQFTDNPYGAPPSWIETAASDAGNWITGAVSDAGEGISDAAEYVADKVGGFFSSLFGGGSEDEAKAKMAKKIKAKMQQRNDPASLINARNKAVMDEEARARNSASARSEMQMREFDRLTPGDYYQNELGRQPR